MLWTSGQWLDKLLPDLADVAASAQRIKVVHVAD